MNQYHDDRGWAYFVRAGLGEKFKIFYLKPAKPRNFGEHAYWDTPWRETVNHAQEDLDTLALVKGWKVIEGR